MKKGIAIVALTLLASVCTICTAIAGLLAYLAVTGLDLLVMAKYEMPRTTLILAIISAVLWIADLLCILFLKPRRKT